jgi:UDP-glucose 4-epimerase
MKVVVTGCAGFIGSNLTEELLRRNYKVIGIDCFTNYYSIKLKRRNLQNLLKSKNFKFLRLDLVNTNLKKFLKHVDYVFHLAAQPGVRASWGKNFEIYVKNNIIATQRLLEQCVDLNLKKIVFASSSSVYGDVPIPMKENSVLKPISPYGVTKLAAENLCYLHWKNYRLPIVCLRYFTVYGKNQRPDMAIAKFTSRILNGERIQVFGNGEQTRDFTFISDAVEATILSAEKNVKGEIINIGSGKRISVNRIIKLLEKEIGKKASAEYIEMQKGDMKHTLADISKAKKLLGWKPKINIEDGIKMYVEWYKKLGNK